MGLRQISDSGALTAIDIEKGRQLAGRGVNCKGHAMKNRNLCLLAIIILLASPFGVPAQQSAMSLYQ